MKKLPYVSSFVDRHGHRRFRFRRTASPTHYFQNHPGEPGFEEEYEACLAGRPPTSDGASTGGSQPKVVDKSMPIVKQARREMAKHPGVSSFVYFVGPSGGPVKIGLATSPDRRMKDLQIGNHARLRLWALIPGDSNDEAEFHRQLSDFKLTGEWFQPTAEVMSVVSNARSLANVAKG
jgi:hypothetical protein